MPTFYCNYYFCLELGGPLHSGAPGLCLPCLPHCYATAPVEIDFGAFLPYTLTSGGTSFTNFLAQAQLHSRLLVTSYSLLGYSISITYDTEQAGFCVQT